MKAYILTRTNEQGELEHSPVFKLQREVWEFAPNICKNQIQNKIKETGSGYYCKRSGWIFYQIKGDDHAQISNTVIEILGQKDMTMKKVDGFNINSPQGAEDYLKSKGVDVPGLVDKGLKAIEAKKQQKSHETD